MTSLIPTCLAIYAIIDSTNGVSTKLDFSNDDSTSMTNSSGNIDDEDVEVKHTIVVSTKLKNNARRGVHSSSDDKEAAIYNVEERRPSKKVDTEEVPILGGYKALHTTQIRTPDTRLRSSFPSSTLINRNIRDENDIYPNIGTNPAQWKPSSYFNNINNWNRDSGISARRNDRPYYSQGKIERRIAEDTAKEFYCKKCMEMSNGEGIKRCTQQRSSWLHEITTTKTKIDGKLAKLN